MVRIHQWNGFFPGKDTHCHSIKLNCKVAYSKSPTMMAVCGEKLEYTSENLKNLDIDMQISWNFLWIFYFELDIGQLHNRIGKLCLWTFSKSIILVFKGLFLKFCCAKTMSEIVGIFEIFEKKFYTPVEFWVSWQA